MDLSILAIIIWLGCFLLVAIDTSMRSISLVFWRLAALVGGPFGLLAYGIIRKQRSRR